MVRPSQPPDCAAGAHVGDLAARLEAAFVHRTTIRPFTETGELASIEDAYAVQQAWAAMRAAAGETTAGRKIGLTSLAMQRQMGVDEPDFGDLWGSRRITDGTAASDRFIQPRVEAEIALLMGAGLAGPGVTERDVRAAADAAAISIEVIDSRIEHWRIRLLDTIADNASYGAFATATWSERLLACDLAAVELRLVHNDAEVMRATGEAVLGSPLTAVAWLANRLGSLGAEIHAGDVVLSGSFGAAVPAEPGDAFRLLSPGQPPLELRFTEVAA
jgi:2-keto-4-pentenoate hydratase